MKKRRILALTAVVLIVSAALALSLRLPGSRGREGQEITLPSQGGDSIAQTPEIGSENRDRVSEITLGRGNVQAVIASLRRPEQYSYTAETTYAYDGGESVFETRGWVRPDLCLVQQYDADGKLHACSVLSDRYVYLWGSEGQNFYQGSRGDFSTDELGRLPTYEELSALPANEILLGEQSTLDGRLCVHVRSGTRAVYTDWYIALDNGLLMRAETSENGKPVYRMRLTAFGVGELTDDLFLLPNGTMPE